MALRRRPGAPAAPKGFSITRTSSQPRTQWRADGTLPDERIIDVRFDDTGLDLAQTRARFAQYQATYGVVSEL